MKRKTLTRCAYIMLLTYAREMVFRDLPEEEWPLAAVSIRHPTSHTSTWVLCSRYDGKGQVSLMGMAMNRAGRLFHAPPPFRYYDREQGSERKCRPVGGSGSVHAHV